jgi:GntR family transcriptional regulator, transcriptional repressor for pyruvate dehydrogenase complex
LYDDHITQQINDAAYMFEKIPARALSDSVAQQLLLQIEKGGFTSTGKLPTEAVLAQEFGVSRTVVREAISRLKNEGMVEPRQGSGVFIVERAGIRPLRIEAEVAAEAAMRRTDEQMDVIEAKLAQIDVAVEQGDDGVTEDVEFHRAIASATGNPYFLTTLAFLNQYLEAGTLVTRRNEALREDFSRQVREEHARIAAAIRARDPLAARNAAQTHLYNAARRLAEAGIC